MIRGAGAIIQGLKWFARSGECRQNVDITFKTLEVKEKGEALQQLRIMWVSVSGALQGQRMTSENHGLSVMFGNGNDMDVHFKKFVYKEPRKAGLEQEQESESGLFVCLFVFDGRDEHN